MAARLTCVLFAFAGVAFPVDNPEYRVAAFGTASWPTVDAVLDARQGGAPQPLTPSDFRLLQDGKAGAVSDKALKFGDTRMGLSIVVAIDASRSMEGKPIIAIRQGLSQLVSRKRENDRVAVMSFADDTRWETRWDSSPDAVRNAFQNLRTRGQQTRLYDAIGQAMDEFATESREDPEFPTRMCILVLSDGHDEGSRASLNQIRNRLAASRIRLDAAGLAHSPLWLRSLQVMAFASFGGFRTANAPDGLTQLLSQGIDLLLDVPALEFRADGGLADGKVHPLGVEQLPTHWRDQMAVLLPKSSFVRNQRVWILVGIGMLLIAGIGNYFARRRGRAFVANVVKPGTVKPEPVKPSLPPRTRTETLIETTAAPRPPTVSMMPAIAAARPATKSSSVLATKGPYAGQRFLIAAGPFWIGSNPNNHLCLNADAAVSGNHAVIVTEGSALRLHDNGSLNNTLVNGQPIGKEIVALQPGDRILIGQSELVLENR